MQRDFDAANEASTMAAVEQAIVDAIRSHQPIVVLEYKRCEPTHSSLMEHLDGRYDRFAVKVKPDNDGSIEVLDVCEERGFGTHQFLVCGVNTDACVKDTVTGLSKRVPNSQIEVLKEACSCGYPYDWEKFPQLSNVVLATMSTAQAV
jgi:hypothetical protein